MSELKHGSMAEFVTGEYEHRPPIHTRWYALWAFLWRLFRRPGEPPWKWRWHIIQVGYDSSTWPEETLWCERCENYTTQRTITRDGDWWTYCPHCDTMRVD